MQRQAGLTLADLVLTAAVVGLLATVAVPALETQILESRMTGRVNGLVHAVHLGKQTAQVRSVDTALCRSPDGVRCDHAGGWEGGWLLFVNADADHPPQADPGEARLAAGAQWVQGRIAANREFFVFRPAQIRSTNGTLVFCDRRGADAARALVISYTGRPRTTRHGPRGRSLICQT